jgi:Domain of unknown function (DUF2019)
MTGTRVSEMSDDDLVQQYAELSAKQGRAQRLLVSSVRTNRIGEQIHEISKELKRRPGDHRSALLKLLSHPDAWVRFNAATSTISIAPVQARQVIQAIADSKVYPQAGQAGMYLSMHDGEASKLLRK